MKKLTPQQLLEIAKASMPGIGTYSHYVYGKDASPEGYCAYVIDKRTGLRLDFYHKTKGGDL